MHNFDLRSKASVKQLHAHLEEALKHAVSDTNVRLPNGGRLSYDPATGEVTLKVSLRVDQVATDGSVKRAEELAFQRMAVLDGVPLDLLGKVATLVDGQAYRVVGAVSRRSEKCYMIQRVRDGKNFMCSARMLKAATTVRVTA